MDWPLLTVALINPDDVTLVRQRARQIAALLGLDGSTQTRFAASVSEIARNAITHAPSARASFSIGRRTPPTLIARITDSGRGIANLDAVLEGRVSGRGIASARRLVDDFTIDSLPGGTEVTLTKRLPSRSPVTADDVRRIVATLNSDAAASPQAELQMQNRELVGTLMELRARQDELERLNTELEDTNRGVVALYAELDERAEQLRQASELKSRFLSNMSHEFRTPLNSILALSRLLLDRIDGPLSPEQERQVGYIRRSAESLTELVNDLLDLAKVEAGKLDVRPRPFTLVELFGALRGVMRPLQQNPAVELVFDDPSSVPDLHTDEAKVAQILRNLISNALKFTEQGEVRTRATYDRTTGFCRIDVADTGIGIAPENHDLVFQEFSQITSLLQTRTKGTGLGLPLSRRLAELLGGSLTLKSQPGQGSIFTLVIPAVLQTDGAPEAPGTSEAASEPAVKSGVLLIDDEETSRYVLRQMLGNEPGLSVLEAASGPIGLEMARDHHPQVIILDLRLPGMDGYEVLDRLGQDGMTSEIPVVVCTSSILEDVDRKRLTRAWGILSKGSLTRELMTRTLRDAIAESARRQSRGVLQ